MKKLKDRWGISSNWQLIIIFIVFAITGSSSVFVAKPFLHWVGMNQENFTEAWWGQSLYWLLRILIIFPFLSNIVSRIWLAIWPVQILLGFREENVKQNGITIFIRQKELAFL